MLFAVDLINVPEPLLIGIFAVSATVILVGPAMLTIWIMDKVAAYRKAIGTASGTSEPAARPASPGGLSAEKVLQLTRERDVQREKILAQTGKNLAMVKAELEMLDKAYERKLVLVRPDGHVAWRSDTMHQDPLSLADRVRGASA